MIRDPLPLSIVEHYAYCPRQAALIHVEAQWVANRHTAKGEADHQAVDRATKAISRGSLVKWTSLPVWSRELGLHGICDVVEFQDGIPCPVEHKPRWRKGLMQPAQQQLAAQAICLEEMFGVRVPAGLIYTRTDNKRHEVVFTPSLVQETLATLNACEALIESHTLPSMPQDARCEQCSLREVCGVAEIPVDASLFGQQELGDW